MITAEEKAGLTVGFKQVLKALKAGKCTKLFLAEDCSDNISDTLRKEASGVEIVSVPTMRELGNMCEIDVSASCAATVRL